MNWETRLTSVLGIQYPIIQGGLAYLAYSELASAVSNAGGLGQITAMSLPSSDDLRKEIRAVKEKTVHPFGVNYAIGQHGRPFEDMLQVAIDEQVPVISMTGGNPTPVFEMLEGTNIKKLVLVASRRQAVKAEKLGADAVMVVGQEGGGHIGKEDVSTMVLTPQVVDHVSIPVVASGGIGDGRGFMAALALGAEGIEMGTRFIATEECTHAHPLYKEALLKGSENDTMIIKKTVGAPGRVVRNEWAEEILQIEKVDPRYEAIRQYISGEANQAFANQGTLHQGFGWAGQVMGRIQDIPTVQELFDRILNEAEGIRNKWNK